MAVRDGVVEFIFDGEPPVGGAAPARVPSNAPGGSRALEARVARLEAELFRRGLGRAGRAAGGAALLAGSADPVEQAASLAYRTGRSGEGAVNSLGGLTVNQKAAGQTALAKAVAGRAGGSAVAGLARASVLTRTLGLARNVASGNVRGVVGKVFDSTAGRTLGTVAVASFATAGVANLVGSLRHRGATRTAQAIGESAFGALGSLVLNPAGAIKEAASDTPWTDAEREEWMSRATENLTLGIGANYRYNKRLAESEKLRGETKAAYIAESQARIDALGAAAKGDAFTTTFNIALRTARVDSIGTISAAMAGAVAQAQLGAEADASRKAEARAWKEVPPVR